MKVIPCCCLLAVVYRGSVRLSKEKWTDDYGDPKSQAFKKLTAELRSAVCDATFYTIYGTTARLLRKMMIYLANVAV